MPFMTNGKRDYKKEAKWEKTTHPQRAVQRAERDAARRAEIKAGKAARFDGKDVDHITPLSKGGKNVASNERVVPASQNRSFSRNADGSMKSQVSKKERAKKK